MRMAAEDRFNTGVFLEFELTINPFYEKFIHVFVWVPPVIMCSLPSMSHYGGMG